jgi:hypothetical protein
MLDLYTECLRLMRTKRKDTNLLTGERIMSRIVEPRHDTTGIPSR